MTLKQNKLVELIVLCGVLGCLYMLDAQALTDGGVNQAGKMNTSQELSSAIAIIQGMLKGAFGKIVALVAFAFGLVGSVFRFNVAAIAGSFGVALAAAIGPSFITSVAGACF